MAAIVQADPYQGLCRKIGYSVGLESLVDRVKKLVSLYVRNRSIGAAPFRDMVVNEFHRNESAVEHFANFYGTLNLLRVVSRDQKKTGFEGQQKRSSFPKALEPLYQLDTLSILNRLLGPDTPKYEQSLKLVLSQCLIEADGDIFLNSFWSDFDTAHTKRRLENLIHEKRRILLEAMPTQSSKINAIVNIKNESKVKKAADEDGAPKGRFQRRTAPLGSARRTTPLDDKSDQAVEIPEDYLEKTSVTRRGWAEDLGWFANGSKTRQGHNLLVALKENIVAVCCTPPTALFWGFGSDLERLRLSPEKLGAKNCEAWDLLQQISSAQSTDLGLAKATIDADELVALLRRIYELYKDANAMKGLIRNSLPLYVAEPVIAGYYTAKAQSLPDLKGILHAEYSKEVRRLHRTMIRGTAGALSFSGVKGGGPSN